MFTNSFTVMEEAWNEYEKKLNYTDKKTYTVSQSVIVLVISSFGLRVVYIKYNKSSNMKEVSS